MPVLKNAKHERFAQEIAKGTDAGEAYEAAGFKPNPGNARRLKLDEAVAKRIEAILSEREHIHAKAIEAAIEKTGISIGKVLEELALLGFSNIADYVDVSGESPTICLQDVPREKLAALSEITTETVYERTKANGAPTEVRRVKIKLWDKRATLTDLLRYLRGPEKLEISGPNGGPVETKELTARELIDSRLSRLAAAERARRGAGGAE